MIEDKMPGMSTSIVLTSNSTKFKTDFSPPIILNNQSFSTPYGYEMALVNLETRHVFPNITMENNSFVYHNGGEWKTILLDPGMYTIKQINSEIQRIMRAKNDWDDSTKNSKYFIHITKNEATHLCEIEISQDFYRVDLNASTIRSILGFNPRELDKGIHKSDNLPKINPVNSILVHCDIITSSYLNGKSEPVLYSFYPNSMPGKKIVETAHNLIYLPITSDQIYNITIWLTDQEGKQLDLRGEIINIRLHIRNVSH
jgi:hypothetical protein